MVGVLEGRVAARRPVGVGREGEWSRSQVEEMKLAMDVERELVN
jgi:hypothetical protein